MNRITTLTIAITIAAFAAVMNATAQTQDNHKQHHNMAGMASKAAKEVFAKMWETRKSPSACIRSA